jgi:hypothetical protein
MKNEIKIGDLVKVPLQEDYGLVIKEDNKNYWVYWFKNLDDQNEGPEVYKYSRINDDHFIVVTKE